jgi:fatty aldehyde decarbonylase
MADPELTTAYREAYSRINGLVIVGEGLADRHFRLLAEALPDDRDELERLAAMEGRHARDFVGCGRNLGIRPDLPLARRLFAPLHGLFREAIRAGDRVSALVIQCLIVESFAVAAYRCYLPVADADAAPITAAVLADEAEHLDYGQRWLAAWFPEVAAPIAACCERAVPVALEMLHTLSNDLKTIGIDPAELVGEFVGCFQDALTIIGFEPRQARGLVARLAGAASPVPALDHPLHVADDSVGIEALVVELFPEATAAFPVGAQRAVAGSQSPFQQPGAVAAAKPGAAVEGFHHQHQG